MSANHPRLITLPSHFVSNVDARFNERVQLVHVRLCWHHAHEFTRTPTRAHAVQCIVVEAGLVRIRTAVETANVAHRGRSNRRG